MAFGQALGPPATGKQVRDLLELLEAAGHTDFRDARGPMGFTQRQAGGKFTRDEAEAFIDQLEAEAHGEGPPPSAATPSYAKARPKAAKPTPARSRKAVLADVSSEDLAAELQQRGWVVLEP